MFKTGFGKAVGLVLIAVFLAGALAAAGAAEETGEETATYFELLEPYVSMYNDNLDIIPDLAKSAFDGERIELHISLTGGGVEIIGIATSKGDCAINEFAAGGLDEPTLRVYIEGSAIDRHLASPEKEEILNTVLNLKVEGVGFINQVKVFVFSLLQRIARWFF